MCNVSINFGVVRIWFDRTLERIVERDMVKGTEFYYDDKDVLQKEKRQRTTTKSGILSGEKGSVNDPLISKEDQSE